MYFQQGINNQMVQNNYNNLANPYYEQNNNHNQQEYYYNYANQYYPSQINYQKIISDQQLHLNQNQQQPEQQFYVNQNEYLEDEIFEEAEFDFSIESLNVFGCLNESIDLLDLQSNQVKENIQNNAANNEEDIFCDDNSTNNGSSNNSSNILDEEQFMSSSSPQMAPISENTLPQLQKISLMSGQGVHLFYTESEQFSVLEEVSLFDDEEIVIIYNTSQLQGLLPKTRVLLMSPGKEAIIRRSLSEYSDREMIASFPLTNESPLLNFIATSDLSYL